MDPCWSFAHSPSNEPRLGDKASRLRESTMRSVKFRRAMARGSAPALRVQTSM